MSPGEHLPRRLRTAQHRAQGEPHHGERAGQTLDSNPNLGRRKFLNTAALAGLTGAGLSVGLSSCKQEAAAPAAAAPAAAPKAQAEVAEVGKYEVAPGQLDEYYAFSSGGHSGECRIYGLPSGREIKRIPVFNMDCLVGWGTTNESKAILGTKPNGTPGTPPAIPTTSTLLYSDGTYDGKYMFVNDKIHGRLARIRMDTMETDKITELPNVQGFHGTFPDKRDPVDEAVNHTTRVFCGAEFSIPLPNDGRDLEDASKYKSLFTCVDAETMEVRWQALIDGNCDLVASSYDGKLAATNQYNTEMGVHHEEMMAVEMDACLFFNVARIEEAVKAGKFTTIGSSKVPVGWHPRLQRRSQDRADLHRTDSQEPARREHQPRRQVLRVLGQTLAHRFGDRPFAGAEVVRRRAGQRPRRGGCGTRDRSRPLHTGFDNKGNAYTTLFLDSQIVKWNVEAAIKSFQGDKEAKPVLDRIDVHYQPGHGFTSMGETKESDGRFFVSGQQVLQGPLPAGWPAARRNRAADRHQRRQDEAGGRPLGIFRAARLDHHPPRHHQDAPDLQPGRIPAGDQGSQGFGCDSQWQESHRQDDQPGTGLQPAGVQGQEG